MTRVKRREKVKKRKGRDKDKPFYNETLVLVLSLAIKNNGAVCPGV